MDWFNKHLNWTWILGIVLGLFVIGIFEQIAKPNYYDNVLSIKEFVSVPLFFIWALYLSIWNLRKKKLPLWTLMVLLLTPFAGIGIWLFLRLPNRNLLVNEKTSEKVGNDDG